MNDNTNELAALRAKREALEAQKRNLEDEIHEIEREEGRIDPLTGKRFYPLGGIWTNNSAYALEVLSELGGTMSVSCGQYAIDFPASVDQRWTFRYQLEEIAEKHGVETPRERMIKSEVAK